MKATLSAVDRSCCRAGVELLPSCCACPGRGLSQPAVKTLVGFGAGGGTDIAARIMAQKMSEIVGQSIVVENRPAPAE